MKNKSKQQMHPVLKEWLWVAVSVLAISAGTVGYCCYKFDKLCDGIEGKRQAREARIDYSLPSKQHPVASFFEGVEKAMDKYENFEKKMDEWCEKQEEKEIAAEEKRKIQEKINLEKQRERNLEAERLAIEVKNKELERIAKIEAAKLKRLEEDKDGIIKKTIKGTWNIVTRPVTMFTKDDKKQESNQLTP